MEPSARTFPPGVIVESVTREGEHHFIKLQGTWDLVNRRDIEEAFAGVPEGFDVVVDVQAVTYCDSTILTEFIRLHRRLQAAGRRVDVILGKSDVRRLFSLTHLDKLLAARSDRAGRV